MHDNQTTGYRRPRLKTGDSFRQPSAACGPIQGRQLLGRGHTPHRWIHRKTRQSSLTGHHKTVGYQFTVSDIAATQSNQKHSIPLAAHSSECAKFFYTYGS